MKRNIQHLFTTAYRTQNPRSATPTLFSSWMLSVQKKVHYSTNNNRKGVYELRTYSILPNMTGKFLAFMKENFHLRTNHSKMNAYWITEIGGVNQVMHLWFYDDLEHRASVRKTLANSDEWKTNFMSNVSPMIQKMDNQLLILHPDSPKPFFDQNSSVYDVHFYATGGHPDKSKENLQKAIKSLQKNRFTSEGSSLVGVWKSVIGEGNITAMIWSHNSTNKVLQLRSNLDQNDAYKNFMQHTSSNSTKMLTPYLTELWSQ